MIVRLPTVFIHIHIDNVQQNCRFNSNIRSLATTYIGENATHVNRVTRLGDFSSFGWLFILDIFSKITEVAYIFALSYPRLKLCINFFTNSSGADVVITIFCDFSQFSAKKIGVFLKYQYYDQLFSKFSFVLRQKRQFFRKIFSENILKS
jgi:hypothetical protein